MTVLLKTLRNAANDLRSKPKRFHAVAFTKYASSQTFIFRTVVLVLLSATTMMSAAAWWSSQHHQMDGAAEKTALIVPAPTPPTAKIIVKLEHEEKPQKAAEALPLPAASLPAKQEVYEDIILPAESLSADNSIAPAPDSDPTIAVVAEKIDDAPVLLKTKTNVNAQRASSAVTFHSEQGATELLDDAHAFVASGNNQAALALYDRVLQGDKNNHAALEGKMFVLQHMGQSEQAVEAGHRLLQADPENATAKSNLVSALGQSYLPASMTELEQQVTASPDNAPAQAALAKLLARRGYYEQSYAHLNKAIELAPTNITYRLDLAVLYDRAGYQRDALSLYRQVLRAAMNEDDPAQLPLPLGSVRQRLAYLEASTLSQH